MGKVGYEAPSSSQRRLMAYSWQALQLPCHQLARQSPCFVNTAIIRIFCSRKLPFQSAKAASVVFK